jgi:cell cycle protein kinase DBF2
MFLAVSALHKLGYIHRDLKPENFLVGANGHIKLTDFGLSSGILAGDRIESMRLKLDAVSQGIGDWGASRRSVKDRRRDYKTLRETNPNYVSPYVFMSADMQAKSVVGSPDYMAPEVLHGTPYDNTVDYWSLGCMLFETLVGYPPFAGETPDETWLNLRHWRKVLERPVFDKDSKDEEFNLRDSAWNFITKCIADRRDRLQTIEEIMADPYFMLPDAGYPPIHWENIRQTSVIHSISNVLI